jgi:hypothetical protein
MTLPRYWTGSIAGVDLKDAAGVDAKVVVEDAANLTRSNWTGTTQYAADGSVHQQLLNIGSKGRAFPATLDFCPVALYAAVIAAIEAHLDSDTAFNVHLLDAADEINKNCRVDFDFWPPKRGTTSGGIIEKVQFRFITTE